MQHLMLPSHLTVGCICHISTRENLTTDSPSCTSYRVAEDLVLRCGGCLRRNSWRRHTRSINSFTIAAGLETVCYLRMCGMFKNPSVQILDDPFQDSTSVIPKQLLFRAITSWISWEKVKVCCRWWLKLRNIKWMNSMNCTERKKNHSNFSV